MIDLKNPEQIALMREGGRMLGKILQELLEASRPGVELLSIDRRADELIAKTGGYPSFKTVKGYRHATCLCVNEEVVHAIPTARRLKEGDILTIDIGLVYQGFHTDTAWTKIIQNSELNIKNFEEKTKFLNTGRLALEQAIKVAKVGNRIGHISKVVQETIESAGYSIVKTLVGHGVGRSLHEEPQVPNYLSRPIEATPELVAGLTVALEPIYAMRGSGAIVYENNDGWTLSTRDRAISAVFEHSIAITPHGPLVLTQGDFSGTIHL